MACALNGSEHDVSDRLKEARMIINLGADVLSRDGDKVGSVGRIVLDANTKAIHKFIIEGGFLSNERRIADVDMVTSADSNSVHLDLTSDQVGELPNFVEQQFSAVSEDDFNALPFVQPNAGGAGMYLYGAPAVGRGYEGTRDSFFNSAPADAPAVQNVSNLEETDVLISEGTDVYGADGEKVGSVDEVVMDSSGQIRGFLVKSGVIFKTDVRIPIDLVDNAGGDRITLSVTGAEAETRGFDIEDTTL
jgi:uncharacterized protein YrrD